MKSTSILLTLLKKFITFGISLAVLTSSFVQSLACGGFYDETENCYQFIYGSNWQGIHPYSFDLSGWTLKGSGTGKWQSNLEAWGSYFNIPAEDISSAFLETSAQDFSELEKSILSRKKLPLMFEKNKLARFWKKHPDHPSFEYARFSKKIEKYTVASPDPWAEVPARDEQEMMVLAEEALNGAATSKDQELQFRYYFQALRLANFGGFYEETIRIYNTYIDHTDTRNELKLQALNHKFGAAWHLNRMDPDNQDYAMDKLIGWLVKVQSECDDCRIMLFDELSAISAEDYLQAEKSFPDVQGKTDMWMLASLQTVPDHYALKQIQAINPLAPERETLLANMLVKRQANVCIPKFIQWEPGENEDGTAALEEELIRTIAAQAQPNQSKWSLAMAYYAYFEKDYTSAKQWCFTAQKQASTEPEELQKNLRVMQKLLEIESWNVSVFTNENYLVEFLRSVSSSEDSELSHYAFSKLHDVSAYGSAPAILHSLLRLSLFGREGLKLSELEVLEERKKATNKSTLETFLWERQDLDLAVIMQLKGSALLNLHRFDEAVLAWNGLPDEVIGELLADPFTYRLLDCHDCDHGEAEKRYPTRKFAEEMAFMQKQILENSAGPVIHFRYANGLYNMTHYGNARYAYSFGITDQEEARAVLTNNSFNGYDFKPDTYFNYYSNQEARLAYIKAAELSNDNEFRAKCTFLAAKCEQNDIYSFGNPKDETGAEVLAPYQHFTELVQSYASTTFYREILEECSYLQDFTRK